jgi:hypothetical protein
MTGIGLFFTENTQTRPAQPKERFDHTYNVWTYGGQARMMAGCEIPILWLYSASASDSCDCNTGSRKKNSRNSLTSIEITLVVSNAARGM